MKFKIIGITGSKGVLGRQIKKKKLNVLFDYFNGDISKKKDIRKWLKGKKFDALFHFAAKVPTQEVLKNFKKSLKINYYGTKFLVDEIQKNNTTKWFLFASTSHVYKFSNKKISENSILDPVSKYGLTKLKAEKYLLKKKFNFKICIVRIFSYTSINQKNSFLIPSIYKKFKNNKIINLKNIHHVRDFIDIDDICSAIKLLYAKKSIGIFNLGSGKATKLIQIIKFFSNLFKKKYKIEEKNKITSHVANISKLKKLGCSPKKNIKKTLYEYHLNFVKKYSRYL